MTRNPNLPAQPPTMVGLSDAADASGITDVPDVPDVAMSSPVCAAASVVDGRVRLGPLRDASTSSRRSVGVGRVPHRTRDASVRPDVRLPCPSVWLEECADTHIKLAALIEDAIWLCHAHSFSFAAAADVEACAELATDVVASHLDFWQCWPDDEALQEARRQVVAALEVVAAAFRGLLRCVRAAASAREVEIAAAALEVAGRRLRTDAEGRPVGSTEAVALHCRPPCAATMLRCSSRTPG